MNRMEMVGQIRDMVDDLYAEGRFEIAKEILGEIHCHNFSGVVDAEVVRIWTQLKGVTNDRTN